VGFTPKSKVDISTNISANPTTMKEFFKGFTHSEIPERRATPRGSRQHRARQSAADHITSMQFGDFPNALSQEGKQAKKRNRFVNVNVIRPLFYKQGRHHVQMKTDERPPMY